MWRANGGGTTIAEFVLLDMGERGGVLDFVRNLPTHKIISVNNQSYYLVHAMPYEAKKQKNSPKMSKEDQMLWELSKAIPTKKK